MTTLDYEFIETDEGEVQIWTPDETGGIIGSGKTEQAAILNAINNLSATVAELGERLRKIL